MIYTILESIRYTLTLLFGIFVSALFLDIRINKKNVICLFLFSSCSGLSPALTLRRSGC